MSNFFLYILIPLTFAIILYKGNTTSIDERITKYKQDGQNVQDDQDESSSHILFSVRVRAGNPDITFF